MTKNSTLEQLHERRKQEVRLHRKGYAVMQIIELSGLSYPTVLAGIDRYVLVAWLPSLLTQL